MGSFTVGVSSRWHCHFCVVSTSLGTSCSCSLLTSRWMCFCSCSLRQWLRPCRGVARAYAGYGFAASHSTCLPKGLGAHYNVQRERTLQPSLLYSTWELQNCV